MNLEKHISTLLYSYDCVIVPGFGAFLTHKNSSVLNGNLVSPPSKNVGFNAALQKSDGLLIQTYAQANQISFDAAQLEVERQINFWRNHLDKNNSLILNELGRFSKDDSGKLQFHPYETNYSLESFGLENLRTQLIMQPTTQTQNSNGVWWKVAAMVPILVGGYLYFAQPQPVAKFVNEQWSGFFAPNMNSQAEITEAVPAVQVMDPIPVTEAVVEENIIHNHQVIAGSFRLLSEAKTLEQKLKEEGFDKARFTQKKGSYFYVAFDTFSTEEEAQEFKRMLSEKYADAWVLSLKD